MSNISKPRLPSVSGENITHPSMMGTMIRERTSYWWPSYQAQLEDEAEEGKRTLVHGTFYVFLEDEMIFSGKSALLRYGSVYMTDHWIMQTVMVPKGHPDADVAPYKMERIIEEWRYRYNLSS
jgi:hypothetical protein